MSKSDKENTESKKSTSNEQLIDQDSFFSHLTELRDRLINSLWAILGGMILCFTVSDKLFAFIRRPIEPYLQGGGLVFTAPMDKFLAHIKISLVGGVLMTCPLWLYQVWKFVSPGLYLKEKRYAFQFIFFGSLLFVSGALFAYFAVFPMAFPFLMGYGGDTDKPMITIDHYLSFFTTTTLMFGAAFEIPLILVILGIMGIISQSFLKKNRRYLIMGLAVIAAIITPPDLFSMILMLIPMIFLFELSIFLVGFFERKRLQNEG